MHAQLITISRMSACPFLEVILYGNWSLPGMRVIHCPEVTVRVYPYLGGRNVVKLMLLMLHNVVQSYLDKLCKAS